MRVRSPLHSIDVRGRFGVGPVFSIWRGLNYARIFTVPVNPRSARQLAIRGLMTDASRAWAGLTDDNRDTWDAYAAQLNRKNVFGQDLRASGFNEYAALYVISTDAGETPSADAPVTDPPILVVDGAIVAGDPGGNIAITWSAEQDGHVDVWMTPLLGAGRKPQASDFRHLSYTPDATATLIIANLTEDGKYSVKIRQVFATGQSGPWFQETLLASTGA